MNEGDSHFRAVVDGLTNDQSFAETVRTLRTPTSRLSEVFRVAEHTQIFMDDEISDVEFAKAAYLATRDPLRFDGLAKALSIRLMVEGRELSPSMRCWIAGVLSGQVSRPAAKGGTDKIAGGFKRIMVANLVSKACSMGLNRTRNVATGSANSACDAVVEALAEAGFHTSYDAVSKSWTKFAQVWMKGA